MTVCLDTNVFLQIFGRKQPFHQILCALLDGRLTLAVSNEILLEYEEVTVKFSGAERWRDVVALLELLDRLHGYTGRQSRSIASPSSPPTRTTTNSAIAPSRPKRISW